MRWVSFGVIGIDRESMLGTFILGIIGGVAAPYAEPRIQRLIEDLAMAKLPLDSAELRSLSLSICLLLAALLSALLSGGGAVALCFGAVVGIFGPRVWARFRGTGL